VASGALVGKLDHADDVQSVVLSPDGSALAFGDGDKMVKLWHLRSVQAAGR
jgi:WD40 repeat protein